MIGGRDTALGRANVGGRLPELARKRVVGDGVGTGLQGGDLPDRDHLAGAVDKVIPTPNLSTLGSAAAFIRDFGAENAAERT
jgi:hypothetical protein